MPMNHFGVVGLGTRKYQPDNEPVRVCEEMLLPGCDCCRIGPCRLCLEWIVDDVVEDNGKALGDGEEWNGSAGAIDFKAYWDESYCTINVELDGELVWSKPLLNMRSTAGNPARSNGPSPNTCNSPDVKAARTNTQNLHVLATSAAIANVRAPNYA